MSVITSRLSRMLLFFLLLDTQDVLGNEYSSYPSYSPYPSRFPSRANVRQAYMYSCRASPQPPPQLPSPTPTPTPPPPPPPGYYPWYNPNVYVPYLPQQPAYMVVNGGTYLLTRVPAAPYGPVQPFPAYPVPGSTPQVDPLPVVGTSQPAVVPTAVTARPSAEYTLQYPVTTTTPPPPTAYFRSGQFN